MASLPSSRCCMPQGSSRLTLALRVSYRPRLANTTAAEPEPPRRKYAVNVTNRRNFPDTK